MLVGVTTASLGGFATAKALPITKMKLRLDDRRIVLGEAITGTVRVWTRAGRAWKPLAGADLSVLVSKVEVGQVTADEQGVAAVSYTPAAVGGFALKLVYPGDSAHRRAKRAKGFEVVAPVV